MISAIISTYNRERYLPQVLNSLKEQTLAKDGFEIIVINNNSTDETESISKSFEKDNPDIAFQYFMETSQGLSYARNRGIKESKGELVTFIDDDAFLEKDYLERIVEYFDANPESVAVGSKILLHYEDVIPTWENKYLNSLLGYFEPSDEPFIFNAKNYPRGSNMSFRTSVFEEVGDFNVNLGRVGRNLAGSEEKDLFQRIYLKKMTVGYIPDALVYHCVPIERTTVEFIRRQGIGTGQSEWQRVKNEGGLSPLKRIFSELIKWGASFVLLLSYSLQGKFAKGYMILRFRYWVSKGIIQRN